MSFSDMYLQMTSVGGVLQFSRPIAVAVRTQRASIVALLLRAGADVNAVHTKCTVRSGVMVLSIVQPMTSHPTGWSHTPHAKLHAAFLAFFSHYDEVP